MLLNDQVCTIEQGKRLKQLGINPKTIFYRHVNQPHGPVWCNPEKHVWNPVGNHHFEIDVDLEKYMVAVFTVAELGVMLGKLVKDCFLHGPTMMWSYQYAQNPSLWSNQAYCYADRLIHALQNNLVTAEDCNKRLLK